MKTRIIIVCLLLFIAPLIMIEAGAIHASLYKNTFTNKISSSWSNTKSVVKSNDSNERITLPDIPVVVVYKSITVGDINADNPVRVDISDKDLGKLWSPFVTKSEYNFPVNFIYKHEIDSKSMVGHMTINADIKVSGKYKIIGLYSKEISTKLVAEKVLNDIYNNIKKNLHNYSLELLNGK
jgi:hypothetical protein